MEKPMTGPLISLCDFVFTWRTPLKGGQTAASSCEATNTNLIWERLELVLNVDCTHSSLLYKGYTYEYKIYVCVRARVIENAAIISNVETFVWLLGQDGKWMNMVDSRNANMSPNQVASPQEESKGSSSETQVSDMSWARGHSLYADVFYLLMIQHKMKVIFRMIHGTIWTKAGFQHLVGCSRTWEKTSLMWKYMKKIRTGWRI